MKKMKNYII